MSKKIKLGVFIVIAIVLTFGGIYWHNNQEVEEIEITVAETPVEETMSEAPPRSIFEIDMTNASVFHVICGVRYEVMSSDRSIYSIGTVVNETRYVNVREGVNVREFPNTAYDNIYTAICYGEPVWVVAEFNEGWSLVEIGDHQCYCRSEYLSNEAPTDVVYIDGEVAEYLGTFKLTAYCECEKCCGKWANDNKTASGTAPTEGRTIACNDLPFGTKVNIFGNTYIVEDRGVSGMHIDIYFKSHEDARKFGVKYEKVYALHDTVVQFSLEG